MKIRLSQKADPGHLQHHLQVNCWSRQFALQASSMRMLLCTVDIWAVISSYARRPRAFARRRELVNLS